MAYIRSMPLTIQPFPRDHTMSGEYEAAKANAEAEAPAAESKPKNLPSLSGALTMTVDELLDAMDMDNEMKRSKLPQSEREVQRYRMMEHLREVIAHEARMDERARLTARGEDNNLTTEVCSDAELMALDVLVPGPTQAVPVKCWAAEHQEFILKTRRAIEKVVVLTERTRAAKEGGISRKAMAEKVAELLTKGVKKPAGA